MLDCETHRCKQVCHRGPCQPCPRSPRLVRSCPCGQTVLAKLLELGYPERRSCSDPIPSCGKTCNKPLPCGSNGKTDSVSTCMFFLWDLNVLTCSLMSLQRPSTSVRSCAMRAAVAPAHSPPPSNADVALRSMLVPKKEYCTSMVFESCLYREGKS